MPRGWVAGGCLLMACKPPVVPSTPLDTEATEAPEALHPLEPEAPANQSAGDQLDLQVPAVEGGVVDLGAFAGRCYLLTIGEPDTSSWDRAVDLIRSQRAQLTESQGANPAAVEFVLVASTPDATALDDLIVPWHLGWDPQGALAARLEIARLPTSFVVGPDGRIQSVVRDLEPEHVEQITTDLSACVASSPAS